MDRRNFLSAAAAAATALTAKEVIAPSTASAQTVPGGQVLMPSIWSRHVQWVRTRAQTDSDP